MTLPADYDVDFSAEQQDIVSLAKTRVLTEFGSSQLFQGLLAALNSEIQALSTAITSVMTARTLQNARGQNLTTLGAIVGATRTEVLLLSANMLTEDAFNIETEDGVNILADAPNYSADDDHFMLTIRAKIASNFNKSSSVPELVGMISSVLGIPKVSVVRTGLNALTIHVSADTSSDIQAYITSFVDSETAEKRYLFPYPAAASVSVVADL